MKKTLIAVVLLLGIVSIGKVTSDQIVGAQSPIRLQSTQSPFVFAISEMGSPPYLTHPEFTEVMTATVTTAAQNTGDGYIFLAAATQFYPGPSALLILEETGQPLYIKLIPGNLFLGDFKKQTKNGVDFLTYYSGIPDTTNGVFFGTSHVLDNNYQEVDTWTIDIGNGPIANVHEFLLLNNGNAIQLAYSPAPFDLTPYGGPPNGTIIDVILQEQDENKNVVFEWKASEHLPIDDTEANLNTTEPIDFLHTNAIAVDYDGNWLLSHRHFSEITKINRQTGDIIWRMGGKGNEFTFTNDIGFYNQHNINRLNIGTITLFDNGNQHTPRHSRAIEYLLDEVTKTATRIWMYPEDTSEYSNAMGNFQRLTNFPDSNSFIGWGSQPQLTEVAYDGSVALEMQLSGLSYRAFRYDWDGIPIDSPRAVIHYDNDPTAVTIYTSWNGATDITDYEIYAGTTITTMSMVSTAPRAGFETIISISGLPTDTCFFQTKPVHAQGISTPFSNMMFRADNPVCMAQLKQTFMPLTVR